jgi:hypothetical protein
MQVRFLGVAAVLLLALLCTPPIAVAQEGPPPPPHAFFGEVTVDGRPAPAGAVIEGRADGIRTGIPGNPITVVEPGRYGGPTGREEKLVLQGRVADGLALAFYIDGVRAMCAVPGGEWQESFPFQSGGVTALNLRVGSAPAVASLPPATEAAPTQSAGAAPSATPPPPQATAPPPPPAATPAPAVVPGTTAPATAEPVAQAQVSAPVAPAASPIPEAQPQLPAGQEPAVASTAAPPPASPAPSEGAVAAAALPRATATPLLQARGTPLAASAPVAETAAATRDLGLLPALGGLSLAGALVIGLGMWGVRRLRGG